MALSREVEQLFDAVFPTPSILLLLLLVVACKVVQLLLEDALKIVLSFLLLRLAFGVLALLFQHVRLRIVQFQVGLVTLLLKRLLLLSDTPGRKRLI